MTTKVIPAIFTKHPETAKAFSELASFADSLGHVVLEEKKTCAHLVVGKAAFLGVHPRKSGLRLTVVLSRPIESARIVKCDKASAKRYHIDLDVEAAEGLDEELKGWISEAHKRNKGL
jgi:hypothetical protein